MEAEKLAAIHAVVKPPPSRQPPDYDAYRFELQGVMSLVEGVQDMPPDDQARVIADATDAWRKAMLDCNVTEGDGKRLVIDAGVFEGMSGSLYLNLIYERHVLTLGKIHKALEVL